MSTPSIQILLVEDEKDLRESLREALQTLGHQVIAASSAEEALERFEERGRQNPLSLDLILLDVRLPGQSGLNLLSKIKRIDPSLVAIVMTAHANIKDAVEAMKNGALTYLEKPVALSDLQNAIDQVVTAKGHLDLLKLSIPQNSTLWSKLSSDCAPILISGERGTGKEVVARAIHANSSRRQKPFISVAINSEASAESMNADIFGAEKGYNGIESRHLGKLQSAEGGTLFIYDVGLLPTDTLDRVLKFINMGTYQPMNSTQTIRSDVRVLFATRRDTKTLPSTIDSIELKSLREQFEQFDQLIHYFIDKLNQKVRNKEGDILIRGIRENALNALKAYNWQGNLRELESVLERAFQLEPTDYLSVTSLPETITKPAQIKMSSGVDRSSKIDFHAEKELFERNFIVEALTRFNGRINQTVLHAGIPKNTLLRKIRKYGLTPSDYGPVDANGEESPAASA